MTKTTSLLLAFCMGFLCALPAEICSQESNAQENNAQENNANDDISSVSRETIPEELLRPRRGEAPRYALDTVIGPLGRGEASTDAYTFARKIAENLIKGNSDDESLNAVGGEMLEGYLGVLEAIGPRNFRLGSGRVENDGAVSFLIRFIGRELAITGELYVRLVETKKDEENDTVRSRWVFEELILEDAQSRKEESDKAEQRFDFSPYHRFF